MVTNTPDVLTEEVADTALGLLINTVRDLPRAETYLRDGRWARERRLSADPADAARPQAGIFGMGRIGLAIARRLEAFGLPVAYHNRRPVAGLAYALSPDADRAGRGGRHADFGGARRRFDAKGGQCRQC